MGNGPIQSQSRLKQIKESLDQLGEILDTAPPKVVPFGFYDSSQSGVSTAASEVDLAAGDSDLTPGDSTTYWSATSGSAELFTSFESLRPTPSSSTVEGNTNSAVRFGSSPHHSHVDQQQLERRILPDSQYTNGLSFGASLSLLGQRGLTIREDDTFSLGSSLNAEDEEEEEEEDEDEDEGNLEIPIGMLRSDVMSAPAKEKSVYSPQQQSAAGNKWEGQFSSSPLAEEHSKVQKKNEFHESKGLSIKQKLEMRNVNNSAVVGSAEQNANNVVAPMTNVQRMVAAREAVAVAAKKAERPSLPNPGVEKGKASSQGILFRPAMESKPPPSIGTDRQREIKAEIERERERALRARIEGEMKQREVGGGEIERQREERAAVEHQKKLEQRERERQQETQKREEARNRVRRERERIEKREREAPDERAERERLDGEKIYTALLDLLQQDSNQKTETTNNSLPPPRFISIPSHENSLFSDKANTRPYVTMPASVASDSDDGDETSADSGSTYGWQPSVSFSREESAGWQRSLSNNKAVRFDIPA